MYQVCAAVEPGEELFPPAQAVRFGECQCGSRLKIFLGIAVRAEDGMKLGSPLLGEDDNVSEIEMPPELRNDIIGNAIRLRRTFVRIIDQELAPGVIVTTDDLVMAQPGIIGRV